MTPFESILRTITFIEDNMCTEINVADMAKVAAYSLYHFCRMFSKFTRHTPYDYLIRRRMTLAAHDVIMTERNIIDIALDYQFKSHEGFTRAFQRIFGMAPIKARRQSAIPAVRWLPCLTQAHLTYLQQQNGLVPEAIPLPAVSNAQMIYHPPPDNLTLQPNEMVRIVVPANWPGSTRLPSDDNTPLPASEYTMFTLSSIEGLSLGLDWILHVWLFLTSHELRLSEVLLQKKLEGEGTYAFQLYVPTQKRHKTA